MQVQFVKCTSELFFIYLTKLGSCCVSVATSTLHLHPITYLIMHSSFTNQRMLYTVEYTVRAMIPCSKNVSNCKHQFFLVAKFYP